MDARRDRPAPTTTRRPRSPTPSSGCCATCASPSRTGRRCTPRPSPWSTSSTRTRRRSRPRSCARAVTSSTWLADDHFTFLGYREYQLEAEEGAPEECGLRALPGSGLGILRHDQDLSASFAKLPPLVKAKAREKKLLVLAKANSRSTVHRPAYLDYVGVKTFGPDGEVVGERRFLGLFSSAAYTESVTRIPVLREKVTEVMRHAGFDPRSHAGKALMDTLENYPRDELFHTSPDELAPVAQDVMSARERRQLRAFVRRDTYGRYVSVLVYLPRDRYSTAVRERFAADPHRGPRRRARRVHRPGQRVHDRPRALRGPPAQGRPDPRDRRRRPRAPAHRGVALVARRLRGRRRQRARRRRGRRGSRGPGPTPSPRPTRRTTSRSAARPTSAGSRPSRARWASTSRCSTRTSAAATTAAASRGSRSSASASRCR